MIKYHYLFGGVLSTLIAGTALPISVSAADASNSPAVTVARPTVGQLQAAIKKLEAVGSYEAYFINQTATLEPSDPFYAEYRYLNKLVHDINVFIARYDDLPDALLQDAILASEDAVRGCNLLFNGTTNKTVITTGTQSDPATTPSAAVGKSQTQAPVSVSSAPATQTTANTKASTVAKTNEAAAIKTATETSAADNTPVVNPTENTSNAEDDNTKSEDNDAETNIPVPATGEVTEPAETGSPLPLFAAIIAGAAATSIIIAAVLHRQPKSRF